MKIFSAEQIKAWDEYTMREEPISSEMLMERAAERCFAWLVATFPAQDSFTICCGKGNNGGDGLVVARLLAQQGKKISVYVLEFGYLGTPDFQLNLSRLHQFSQVIIRFVQTLDQLPVFDPAVPIIDALYGTGLNRGLEGISAAFVQQINASGCVCVSIDLPSGLFADRSSLLHPVIRATHTLCLQTYKLAMLMAENDVYLGQVHLLSIGLHPGFYEYAHTKYELQLLTDIKALRPTRNKSVHKGNFGHALLVGGQVGKMGAMVLAAKGALRSGLGLLSCQVPAVGLNILQTSVPEAMCSVDNRQECISQLPKDLSLFQSIGIGPGMGTKDETIAVLNEVLSSFTKPIVIDADALNVLAMHPALLNKVPAGSVLTPHPKEFARLFGESANDFERLQKAIDKATRHQVYIVLKGHHTQIACPEGNLFFNGSGNPGMATGGMGDVLTGVITGLLAQQIPVQNAVRLGVYLHGLAGNLAAQAVSEPALLPSDLIDHLGAAWLALD